ncbi:LysR family transcriptional regulator [Devosia sp. YIM 151766]|uniref:winged helix-turn-helix domain-containing protein n=1 Tax=Devosia sp. YIM 151766 TaxID=3017325 RepID=UPI00255CB9DA|nr:LysR family transcriptional regulator [Devosia sp. YIM 151766]WIY52412.1 LysR family transcriptional regulator [Devosia sp. YIM 151766]
MSKPVPEHGLGHLRIVLTDTAYIGPGRADLLEGIVRTGSISAAGKAMGMSYKRAWSLVQALNEGFGRALVVSSRGGAAQGGASLTPLGHEVLEKYRAMQDKAQAAIGEDVAALRSLITDRSG